MALKPFYLYGTFSGRTTPVAGGPKISQKHAEMEVDIFQRDNADAEKIVHVKSVQEKRNLKTTVTVYTLDGQEHQFEINSKY